MQANIQTHYDLEMLPGIGTNIIYLFGKEHWLANFRQLLFSVPSLNKY